MRSKIGAGILCLCLPLLMIPMAEAATYIGTTSEFEAGVHNHTATFSTFNTTPENLVTLRQGVNYSANFDNESIPCVPAGWYLTASGTHLGETTSHYVTADRSLQINGRAIKNISVSQEYTNIYTWVYLNETDETHILQFQNSTTYDATGRIYAVKFVSDGTIDVLNGAGWTDSGETYTTGWHLIKIRIRRSTSRHWSWYDGALLCSAGDCRCDPWTSIRTIIYDTDVTNPVVGYLDDIIIGWNYTAGNYTTQEIELPANQQISNISLRYNVTATNNITQIIITGNGTRGWYNTTIDTGDNITINETMLTGGSIEDIDENFTIQFYFEGNATDRPTLTNITINFEADGNGNGNNGDGIGTDINAIIETMTPILIILVIYMIIMGLLGISTLRKS